MAASGTTTSQKQIIANMFDEYARSWSAGSLPMPVSSGCSMSTKVGRKISGRGPFQYPLSDPNTTLANFPLPLLLLTLHSGFSHQGRISCIPVDKWVFDIETIPLIPAPSAKTFIFYFSISSDVLIVIASAAILAQKSTLPRQQAMVKIPRVRAEARGKCTQDR